MAPNTAKLSLQRLSHPVADRLGLGTGPLAHSPDEAFGPLDGEDVFGFRNGQWNRLLLGGRMPPSTSGRRPDATSGGSAEMRPSQEGTQTSMIWGGLVVGEGAGFDLCCLFLSATTIATQAVQVGSMSMTGMNSTMKVG